MDFILQRSVIKAAAFSHLKSYIKSTSDKTADGGIHLIVGTNPSSFERITMSSAHFPITSCGRVLCAH